MWYPVCSFSSVAAQPVQFSLICPSFLTRLDPHSIFLSGLWQHITSCHVYTKWSAVAKPPIWTLDHIALLFMSLCQLISYLVKKSSCHLLQSNNILALPQLLTTLAKSLLAPHPLVSSSIAPLRGLCDGVSSLSCPVCPAFLQSCSVTPLHVYLNAVFWDVYTSLGRLQAPLGSSYKDFSESP